MAVKSGVQVKNLKQVQKSFAQFNNSLGKTKEPFKRAGTWAVDLIISKTTSGKDYKNNSFQNYTSKYASDKGRTKVDLVKSGKMLGAVSFQAFTKKLRIYVKKTSHEGKINTYELAVVHNFGAKAGKNHKAKIPKREFIGLTAKDVDKILKIVSDYYEQEMAKIF